MEDDQRREKLDIVWGCVFLTGFAVWGLTTIVFGAGPGNEPSAIALTIGALVSVVTVPLLLSAPGSAPALLKRGRMLLWLQAACLGGACVAGVITMLVT